MRCKLCGGPAGSIGKLGSVTHYQCRNCGAPASEPPRSPRHATRKIKMVSCVALLPDGSERSVIRTDLPRVDTIDPFGNPIKLPPGTVLIPFPPGVSLMQTPTYEEALKQKIGHVVR